MKPTSFKIITTMDRELNSLEIRLKSIKNETVRFTTYSVYEN